MAFHKNLPDSPDAVHATDIRWFSGPMRNLARVGRSACYYWLTLRGDIAGMGSQGESGALFISFSIFPNQSFQRVNR
jgi:hypothetical protein